MTAKEKTRRATRDALKLPQVCRTKWWEHNLHWQQQRKPVIVFSSSSWHGRSAKRKESHTLYTLVRETHIRTLSQIPHPVIIINASTINTHTPAFSLPPFFFLSLSLILKQSSICTFLLILPALFSSFLSLSQVS